MTKEEAYRKTLERIAKRNRRWCDYIDEVLDCDDPGEVVANTEGPPPGGGG